MHVGDCRRRLEDEIGFTAAPSYTCLLCLDACGTELGLESHVLSHADTVELPCHFCIGGDFGTGENLVQHMRQCHSDKYPPRENDDDASSSPKPAEIDDVEDDVVVDVDNPTELKCDKCPAEFANESALNLHVITKHLDLAKKFLPADVSDDDDDEEDCHASSSGLGSPGMLDNPNNTSLGYTDNEMSNDNFANRHYSYLADEDDPEITGAQDLSAEIREMKLKGEFPCRLCTMIFPNLR
jgi:hypothetical protein